MRTWKCAAIAAAFIMAAGCIPVMAGEVSGDVTFRLRLTHTSTNPMSTASETLPTLVQQTITNVAAGVNASNAMNQIWYTSRTLAGSGMDDLDLCGGITDSFGVVVNMAHVRVMAVQTSSTNAGSIGVGGAAANGLTSLLDSTNSYVKIPANGLVLWYCGTATAYSNAAASTDTLRITNMTANPATYSIYLGGTDK